MFKLIDTVASFPSCL